MYTTYTDDPETPTKSNILNALYTSIPSYVSSDHVRPTSQCSHLYERVTVCFVNLLYRCHVDVVYTYSCAHAQSMKKFLNHNCNSVLSIRACECPISTRAPSFPQEKLGQVTSHLPIFQFAVIDVKLETDHLRSSPLPTSVRPYSMYSLTFIFNLGETPCLHVEDHIRHMMAVR